MLTRCYGIFNLAPGASLREVKRAYRAFVKEWHPDRFHGQKDQSRNANEKLKTINGAFALLSAHLSSATANKITPDILDDEVQALTETDPDKLYKIGLRLFRRCKTESYVSAFNCFRRAAASDHSGSQYEIGKLYEAGIGAKQNVCAAGEFYVKAAKNGHELAFDRLKDFEAFAPTGYGRERFEWYKNVASCGIKRPNYSSAIFIVGESYSAI